MQFFIFLQKSYVNIYKTQKIMAKKRTPTLEKRLQGGYSKCIEIIQARKEISSIIMKNNDIYIDLYIFYIFTKTIC